jgi:hypothetical protein
LGGCGVVIIDAFCGVLFHEPCVVGGIFILFVVSDNNFVLDNVEEGCHICC